MTMAQARLTAGYAQVRKNVASYTAKVPFLCECAGIQQGKGSHLGELVIQ